MIVTAYNFEAQKTLNIGHFVVRTTVQLMKQAPIFIANFLLNVESLDIRTDEFTICSEHLQLILFCFFFLHPSKTK